MKESNVIKSIAYILLFILPILILAGIGYGFVLSEDEEILKIDNVYELRTLKQLYISDLYESKVNIHDILYYEDDEVLDEQNIYAFYQDESELIDFVVINSATNTVYTNIDMENEAYRTIDKENLINTFQNENEKYVIFQKNNVITNIPIMQKSTYELKYFYDEIVATFEQENEEADITIYSKVREDKPLNYQIIAGSIELFKKLGRAPIIVTPILFVIFVITLIYVIISAGHKKGEEGIYQSGIDKIPYDIFTIFLGLIVTVLIALGITIVDNGLERSSTSNVTSFSMTTVWSIVMIAVAYTNVILWFVSSVRRIKLKTIISNNVIIICVKKIWKIAIFCIRKIWQLIIRCLRKINRTIKKICANIKECIKNIWYNFSLNFRILAILFGFAIITDFLFFAGLRNIIFILVLLAFWFVMIYYIVKKVANFKLIKKSLKAIYDGDNNIELEKEKFTGDLKDMSHYIKDISSGFSNAIEQGIKSERMKAELITNVSHDIKTPLTSIINYVDLLKKEDIQNEKAKEYIGILDSKSQRLKRLIEDLVEASKASSGNLVLNITKIDLEELLNQSIGEFGEKFDEKGLEILFDVKKEKSGKIDRIDSNVSPENIDKLGKIANIHKNNNIHIKADSRYMYRIIENLFSNIYKYALENSRVYIDLVTKDGEALVIIKNISSEKLNISEEELMQRFVRGDKSRTTEGSGLGLSITESLTNLQKGKFEINIDGDLFKTTLKFPLA